VIELIGQKPVSGWGYRAMWIPTDSVTVWVDRRTGEWGAPSAHNAFLEITLELGLIGLASLILIVCQGLWRAIRCCALGLQPFGLFSLVFFVGAILAGQTIETLGINQEIDWLVFTILSFLGGERLAAVASRYPNREDGLKRTPKNSSIGHSYRAVRRSLRAQ
jgi:exopolysaccharide production protein ExoQ